MHARIAEGDMILQCKIIGRPMVALTPAIERIYRGELCVRPIFLPFGVALGKASWYNYRRKLWGKGGF